MSAARAIIDSNEVYGNTVGIDTEYRATSSIADRIIVRNNTAHDNASIGISGANRTLITGNIAFGQVATDAVGIVAVSSYMSTEANNNIVYNNDIGLRASSFNGTNQLVTQNRAYHNNVGIRALGASRVDSNQVYSNATGISGDSFYGFQGLITNNLIYANTNQGVFIERSFNPGGRIVNNTVYQPVGDAIRIDNTSQGMSVQNNILDVDSGHDIYVTANSQGAFISDYNLLYHGADPNAHVGFWSGQDRHLLADWQAATTQDAHSLAADPLFVDIDGSDNVLGFASTGPTGGTDGGRDDNFHLRGGSPAIDRADAVAAPVTDREGNARVDDPGTPNSGTPTSSFVDLGAFEFQGSTLDTTPPTLVASSIVVRGSAGNRSSELDLTFSEPIDPVDAAAVGNYDLREAGADGVFGNLDDVTYPLRRTMWPARRPYRSTLLSTAGYCHSETIG